MPEAKIDLTKLSQKELLIVTYRKVEEMSEELKATKAVQNTQQVKLAVVESKLMTWAAVFGAIAGGLVTGIISLIK